MFGKLLKNAIITNFGQKIVLKLVKTIENIPVSSVREYIRDVLVETSRSFNQESQIWFKEALYPVLLF